MSILIISGLPGSGKTTYALNWVEEDPDHRARINYDDLRLNMFGPDWTFNHDDEKKMKDQAIRLAVDAIGAGRDLVIDNTNLTERARNPWITLAKASGEAYELMDIDTPVSTCVERDRGRAGNLRVGRAVIERMALFTGWIDWDESQYDGEFVILDVDGTIADCSHRRHYVDGTDGKKNWTGFHAVEEVKKDPPIMPIVRLVHEYFSKYNLLVVSGRSPEHGCGIATEDWLEQYGIKPMHLFMRNAGDYRPDFEIKQEILDLLPKNRIAYVLDDRPQVLRMWQRNGLTTLAVGLLTEF